MKAADDITKLTAESDTVQYRHKIYHSVACFGSCAIYSTATDSHSS